MDATQVTLGVAGQEYDPLPAPRPPTVSLLKTLPDDLSRLARRAPDLARRLWKEERHWLWVLIPLFLALLPALRTIPGFWFIEDAPLWFQILVPALSALLIWERRREWQPFYQYLTAQFTPDSAKRRGYLIPVIFSCLVLLVGSLTTTFALWVAGFVLLVISIFYYLYGFDMLRLLWMPLAYLAVMIPPPMTALSRFSQLMQQTTLAMTSAILRPIEGSVKQVGTALITPSGTIVVTPLDTGRTIILSVLALGLWVALRRRISVFAALIVFALALALALTLNVLRVAFFGKMGISLPAAASILMNFVVIGIVLFFISRAARYLSRYNARVGVKLPGME